MGPIKSVNNNNYPNEHRVAQTRRVEKHSLNQKSSKTRTPSMKPVDSQSVFKERLARERKDNSNDCLIKASLLASDFFLHFF